MPQDQPIIRMCHALLACLILATIPACRHYRDTALPVVPHTLTFPDHAPTATNRPAASVTLAGSMSLSDAITYSLETDSRIATLLDRCQRNRAEISSIHADSPEIRVGYEEGEQDEHGWSSGRSSSGRSSSGREITSGSGTQASESTQSGFTDYGDFFDPDQTSTETANGRESSSFTETQDSSSSSRETETTTAVDYTRQQDEGLSVELRLSPANPWALHAERKAALAATSLAEAELLEEEHDLACDIVDYAIRLHFHRKMAEIHRAFTARAQSVHTKLQRELDNGSLASEDYASGCRVASSATAGSHKLQTRINELEELFRDTTGLDPRTVAIDDIAAAVIIPFPLPDTSAQDNEIVAALMEGHSSILIADWNMKRSKAEWDMARIDNYPWASHLGLGYAWSEGSSYSTRETESEGSETTTSSSTSEEFQSDWSESSSLETETPSGDVTTQTETGLQTGYSQSQSSGTEQERSWSSGTQTSTDEYEGNEWWVEVGIEIPIFDWFSGETRARRRAASSASDAYDRVSTRTQQQILNAITASRRSKVELQRSREELDRQLPALKDLAASAWQQGLTGELDSLQIESDVVEMLTLLLDCSMHDMLSRLNVVRAAGSAPSLNPSHHLP